jgi:hypothetical protein
VFGRRDLIKTGFAALAGVALSVGHRVVAAMRADTTRAPVEVLDGAPFAPRDWHAGMQRCLDWLAATAERYGHDVFREGAGQDYLGIRGEGFGFLTGRYGDGMRSVTIYGEGIDDGMLSIWFSTLARSIASGHTRTWPRTHVDLGLGRCEDAAPVCLV